MNHLHCNVVRILRAPLYPGLRYDDRGLRAIQALDQRTDVARLVLDVEDISALTAQLWLRLDFHYSLYRNLHVFDHDNLFLDLKQLLDNPVHRNLDEFLYYLLHRQLHKALNNPFHRNLYVFNHNHLFLDFYAAVDQPFLLDFDIDGLLDDSVLLDFDIDGLLDDSVHGDLHNLFLLKERRVNRHRL